MLFSRFDQPLAGIFKNYVILFSVKFKERFISTTVEKYFKSIENWLLTFTKSSFFQGFVSIFKNYINLYLFIYNFLAEDVYLFVLEFQEWVNSIQYNNRMQKCMHEVAKLYFYPIFLAAQYVALNILFLYIKLYM